VSTKPRAQRRWYDPCPACGGRKYVKVGRGGRMRIRGHRVQVGTKVTAVSRRATGYVTLPVKIMWRGVERISRDHRKFDGSLGHKTVVIETPIYATPSIRVYRPTISGRYGICPVCGAKQLREHAESVAFMARAIYDEVLDKWVEPPPARKPTTPPDPQVTADKRKAKARRARDARRKASVGRHKARA